MEQTVNYCRTDEETLVTIILLKEGDAYVVQGLQRDIVGQGKTSDEAWEDFGKTYSAEMALGREHFLAIPRAPDYYFNLAKDGFGMGTLHIPDMSRLGINLREKREGIIESGAELLDWDELRECKICHGTKEVPGKAEYPGTYAWPENCPHCTTCYICKEDKVWIPCAIDGYCPDKNFACMSYGCYCCECGKKHGKARL